MGNNAISTILVGCGAVSRFFYGPTLVALETDGLLKVDALVDPVAENLGRLAELFPVAKRASRIEDVPVVGRLVIIASPPKFHAPAAIHALQQGAAVLCEKPMAQTVAEAEAMITASRENRALLAVGLYKRFFPACEAIKGLLEKKPLGALKRFTVEEGGKFGWQAASDSFFKKSVTPGGILLDIGVHVFDLLLWWLDEPLNIIYEDDAMGGQEANCRVVLEYADGVRGEVRLSRDWQTRNEYHFYFERGLVRYKVNDANHLEVLADGMPTLLSGTLHGFSRSGNAVHVQAAERTNPQSFIEQVRNVIAAMRGEQKLRVPGGEGIRSMRVIEQCYAKRRLMPMPWLTQSEQESAARISKGEVQA